jgi:hypothetical protein
MAVAKGRSGTKGAAGRRKGGAPPPVAGAEVASPAHDEWLLDEALMETFPASDPIHPATHDSPQDTQGGSREPGPGERLSPSRTRT